VLVGEEHTTRAEGAVAPAKRSLNLLVRLF
jgi:hypothetical protein